QLIQFKADINAVNEHGNTPLHYACFWGHDQVAEDLVSNGALVSVANKYGETPIDKAKTPLREVLKGGCPGLCAVPGWCGGVGSTRCSQDCRISCRIFSHPNVLPVLGACQAPPAPHPIIISHWMPYGSLYNVLHEGTNFVVDQMQAVKFALDIARGMAFLHTLEPLIPRHHLNSRSIMIDEDMTARISMADVKFSFQCPGRMYAPAWVAPEALQKKPEEINRRSADMWSFAVLLWELVTREVPFADLSNMEIGMKVALEGLRPTIPPGISPHICKLMKICMNEDPAKRPKFDMIVPILEKMQEK
ncbi:Integrin-linked protein kinase, partial [Tinamus guttatus]